MWPYIGMIILVCVLVSFLTGKNSGTSLAGSGDPQWGRADGPK